MKLFDEIRGTVEAVVESAKNVKAVYDHYHNFTDEQLKEIVRTSPRREDTQVAKREALC